MGWPKSPLIFFCKVKGIVFIFTNKIKRCNGLMDSGLGREKSLTWHKSNWGFRKSYRDPSRVDPNWEKRTLSLNPTSTTFYIQTVPGRRVRLCEAVIFNPVQFNLLLVFDNSAYFCEWDTTPLCSWLSFQVCFYNEGPWKTEIMSPSEANNRDAYCSV